MTPLDLNALQGLVRLAGHAVLDLYRNGFSVEEKSDHTPVTTADRRSSEILLEGLARLFPDIPVICEETESAPYAVRRRYKRCFVVDPLDGTKEFIRHCDEFCVLLALVENGSPAFGAIHVPATDTLYCGGPGLPATRRVANGPAEPLRAAAPAPGQPLVILASRSHPDPGLTAYLGRFPGCRLVHRGSALKFCALADGTAHLYPRLGPLREWDIAAGHAVLVGAGGAMTALDGSPLRYNTAELVSGPFLARSFSDGVVPSNLLFMEAP
ncbi:3'(2'),5'-bisphosphate nucleotidase [Solidesulfovibrio carbinoliphilus subsp. oakridgensis]|uniref:3'(2'),5'-bisphosphate nucleotidase CysQ n=1 Tax=Solidesulfovibrio carbinoliphilus subsp. oakridgensis TaxID=694327 RepID=G7QAA3_9BACT|nr:3'(2'),5'-bisphosphate nucleotidase CysQ [Solidesulfovibrio carbinoliphilus]EHJ48254.1 3'(2'),5'-bisphosphate nucleotidase [Solidesulfovibrio carbinoliphilus subsp. oakridgensis]